MTCHRCIGSLCVCLEPGDTGWCHFFFVSAPPSVFFASAVAIRYVLENVAGFLDLQCFDDVELLPTFCLLLPHNGRLLFFCPCELGPGLRVFLFLWRDGLVFFTIAHVLAV